MQRQVVAQRSGGNPQFLRDRGYKLHNAEAGSASLDTAVESLDTLVVFLLIMAILTAVVGAMGLTGTMGMNVLERTREIGIRKVVGASVPSITMMLSKDFMKLVVQPG